MNIMVSEFIYPIPNYNQGLWLKLEGMWFRNKRKSDFTWWVVSSWNLLPQARVRLEMKIPSMLWKILLLTDCNVLGRGMRMPWDMSPRYALGIPRREEKLVVHSPFQHVLGGSRVLSWAPPRAQAAYHIPWAVGRTVLLRRGDFIEDFSCLDFLTQLQSIAENPGVTEA